MAGALAMGCGSGQDTTGSGGQGGGGGGGPAAEELRFDTDVYELEPGEEKNYYCFTTRLSEAADTNVVKISPIYGKAVHHIGVYYTTSDEPDGSFDCPELVRDNWMPLYVGGIDIGDLTMPEGSAIKLGKGKQILVQLHLLNSTNDAVADKSTIVFETSDAQDLIGAGIYGFDNRAIAIPPGGSNVEVHQQCKMPKAMDVFAVNGHMHTLGRQIEFSRGELPGEEVLYDAKWEFEDQPTVPLKLQVNKGDLMNVRCWFDNPGAVDVTYGESSLTEMCAFVLYYTPFESVNGCIKFP